MPEKELKVALLNDAFFPMIDGVVNAVENYAAIIHRDLGNAMVATPRYPGIRDEYPYPVLRYPSLDTTKLVGYRAGYPFSSRVLHQVESFAPDIIHSHCPIASTMLARMLRRRVCAPLIFTYHTKFDIDLERVMESSFLQKAARHMLARNIEACDEVWVVSRGAGENLRSLGYRGDYVLMENGVDFPRGAASQEKTAALRAKLGIAQETMVYLFVGRMMWYKGIRVILEALFRYRRDGKTFSMVFVGDGADREEIESMAKKLGLGDHCRFVGAVRDRELLRVYYSMADLFLFPSTFDTNGIVVREAAACALASVLVRGSCAAEGVEDGGSGLLIEESGESLYRLLCRVGNDRRILQLIGQKAKETLYLSWEESVRRAYERYQLVRERYCRVPRKESGRSS